MTLEPTEVSKRLHSIEHLGATLSHQSHHGSLHCDPSGLVQASSGEPSGRSTRSRDSAPQSSGGGVDADVLDERLRRLRIHGLDSHHAVVPGQRISEYENALALQTPTQAFIRDPACDGVQLGDLPNEILTHIFSHLPPDSHSAVALVSRRFSALISTHHAWRMAFMRHFPGHTAMAPRMLGLGAEKGHQSSSHTLRSDTRYFSRLTPSATWRSEYLLRTRYLRSLARGKPGAPHGAATLGGPRSGKKPAAVLTFNSKLPWRVTSLDATFSNGTKPPRVIQGSGDFGIATIGDPTSGKIEKWGIEDLFSSAQLEEAMFGLVPHGLGQGPAAVPNIVDVSQYYGMLAGEGFPGGRAYFRNVSEPRGRYLNAESAVADKHPDIPRIPRGLEAICSVWLAKSPAVVSTTHHMCGMLTGSSLGIITAYSLGNGTAGSRQTSGEVSARWAVSPGVPIISLKVDESYCQTRRAAKRVWAVALNALGEVFYLTEVPLGKLARVGSQDAMRNAWHAGRTACWHLVQETRRVVKPAAVDDDDLLQKFSAREPIHQQGLNHEQLVAEAREIDKFLMVTPARLRDVFHGWDMQRMLEVDFAGDDGKGAGESIFVADCGLIEDVAACVRRYTRSLALQPKQSGLTLPVTAPPTPSLFGAVEGAPTQTPQMAVEPQSPRSPPPTPKSPAAAALSHGWICQALDLESHSDSVITSVALDNSAASLLTLHEEASHANGLHDSGRGASSLAHGIVREIPGRRARFIVVGTSDGSVLVWNAREEHGKGKLQPIRVIKTESPRVTCVAASALYVVHGGSDGLVQAWDPLSSTLEPVRTICAKSNGRAPRHMVITNERFQQADLSAVGTIFLDPNPTVLQGIVSFGTSLRSWSYSSAGRLTRHKSPPHRGDPDGRLVSRRQAGLFTGHIAAEEAELRREQEQQARERSRLMKRFGALGDLTEEEALVYAQMLSQEEFQAQEEQRRASDFASPFDAGIEDSASSWHSETGSEAAWTTPDASVAGPSNPDIRAPWMQAHENAAHADQNDGHDHEHDAYEQQIEQAIRLSLMEASSELTPPPPPPPPPPQDAGSSPEAAYTIKYKGKSARKHGEPSPSAHELQWALHRSAAAAGSCAIEDEDLMLALSLSMQDQQREHEHAEHAEEDVEWASYAREDEEFPSLPEGNGKGKGVQR